MIYKQIKKDKSEDAIISSINELVNAYGIGSNKDLIKSILSEIFHYHAEMVRGDNGNYYKCWWNNINSKNKDIFKYLLISNSAKEMIKKYHFIPDGENVYSPSKCKIGDGLYIEHITPRSYLCDRAINGVSAEICLQFNKVILITKNEQKYLDNDGFSDNDFKNLKDIKLLEEIKDDKNLPTKKFSRSNGWGPLRLSKLYNYPDNKFYLTLFDGNEVYSLDKSIEKLFY